MTSRIKRKESVTFLIGDQFASSSRQAIRKRQHQQIPSAAPIRNWFRQIRRYRFWSTQDNLELSYPVSTAQSKVGRGNLKKHIKRRQEDASPSYRRGISVDSIFDRPTNRVRKSIDSCSIKTQPTATTTLFDRDYSLFKEHRQTRLQPGSISTRLDSWPIKVDVVQVEPNRRVTQLGLTFLPKRREDVQSADDH